jgi:hypothetical protein
MRQKFLAERLWHTQLARDSQVSRPFHSLALLILFLSAAAGLAASKQEPKKPVQNSPRTSYSDLLARVKKGDSTIDFKELRLSYADTSEYNPYGSDRDTRLKMFAALKAKEFQQAVESAEKILASNFVELNAHFAAYVGNRELGHADKATFHKFMFDGLIKSITGSGDGHSPETAFIVISTDEEYVLFNYLGLRAAEQSLITQNGHSFDRMTATNPKTNETMVYFFNIDKPFNWLGQSLKK